MFNFYDDLLSGEEGMGIIFVHVDVDLAAASLSTRTEVLAAMTLWAGRITHIEPIRNCVRHWCSCLNEGIYVKVQRTGLARPHAAPAHRIHCQYARRYASSGQR